MAPSELLRRVAGVLEQLNIPYRITGSMATIAYGEPRFTNDIDIVVQLRLDQERIDRDYIESWSKRLGVEEEWRLVLAREGASGD